MKRWIPIILMSCQSLAAEGIFDYHEDFKALPKTSERLVELKERLSEVSDYLNEGVEVYAALDTRGSAELLDTSIRLLLHQHASSVNAFVNAKHFEEEHLLASVRLLLKQCGKTREKCRSYMNMIKRPTLFQVILDLDSIAEDIQVYLKDYAKLKDAPKETPKTEEVPKEIPEPKGAKQNS